MAKLVFEWADVWAIFDTLQPQTRKDVLIALESTLKTISPSAQIKALEGAPKPVIKAHAHLLDERAKKKLGLEEKTSKVKTWSFGSLL